MAYSATLATTGGKPLVSVDLISGTAPPGLTVGAGQISGTPTAPGTATLQFVATDANDASAHLTVVLDVAP